jgi:hypothetical protein
MNNEIQVMPSNVSIIDSVNINQVANVMQKISSFQSIVQKTLKQNHDYGIIPGTPKPTLLKPGAEKIHMLMGVQSEYDIIEKVQDYENGFFAFTVKCKLYKGDFKITEGVGHCNTKEKKYIKSDPYTMANTALKMAKKRAQIDATLTIASLSDIFTQDIEDMDLNGTNIEESNRQVYTDTSGVISKAQAKRMFAIAQGNNDLVKEILAKYGYSSSEDVKKTDYNKICEEIEIKINENLEGTPLA